jgi:thiol:disulfide interchange protein DsbC
MNKLKLIWLAVIGFVAVGQCFADEEAADRMEILKRAQPKQMIVYRPANVKAVVTIFTDLQCGYCKKLHREIPKLIDLGIELHYMVYPRHGIGSSSYNTMVSIWCSKDPKEAMTQAMEGEEIKKNICNSHSVADQMLLGRKLGVSGTPTLFFADGTMWGGYLSAEKLAKEAIKHTPKE